ncbi:Pleckstrin homology domain-containing family F member 2 [Manis javanica]|nr:Pleckstrin homology domain-containing family F member 2 [Manis javanica]
MSMLLSGFPTLRRLQSSKPVRICDFCYDLLSAGDMATCQPTRSDSYSQSLKSPLNDASDDDDDDDSSD